MNETLCRALLKARLTEEDVAARLQVDPKTVRRWLEGRVPYLRYRWAIAAMLGADETDLWPQLRPARSRPDEVVAIYPHRDAVPREVWLRVLGSAHHEIGILDDAGMPLAADRRVGTVLGDLAQSGVRVRICACHLDAPAVRRGAVQQESEDALSISVHGALAAYAPLREKEQAEIRLYQGLVYSSICYADDEFLISQHVHAIPAGQVPVLHLRRTDSNDMTAAYLDAFEHAWTGAKPVR